MVLSVDGMLILLPVCRTIMRWVRPKLRFLPLDENIWLHRQLAYSMLIFTICHTTAHYVKYDPTRHLRFGWHGPRVI